MTYPRYTAGQWQQGYDSTALSTKLSWGRIGETVDKWCVKLEMLILKPVLLRLGFSHKIYFEMSE